MINNKAHKESLIKEFIKSGKENSFNLDNTNLVTVINDVRLPQSNILRNKYREFLIQNSIMIDFGDTFEMVKYKPKLLSLKLYGTPDLWHLLLWLNNITSVTNFNRSKIYVFDPDSLHLLNKILDLEHTNILINHDKPEVIEIEEKITRR